MRDPLTHPTVVGLAQKYGKTPAQVVHRWHIQHGVSAIPKSFTPAHISENFDIFDFALSVEDIAAIDAMDRGVRSGPDPERVDANTFPIKIEDQGPDKRRYVRVWHRAAETQRRLEGLVTAH